MTSWKEGEQRGCLFVFDGTGRTRELYNFLYILVHVTKKGLFIHSFMLGLLVLTVFKAFLGEPHPHPRVGAKDHRSKDQQSQAAGVAHQHCDF